MFSSLIFTCKTSCDNVQNLISWCVRKNCFAVKDLRDADPNASSSNNVCQNHLNLTTLKFIWDTVGHSSGVEKERCVKCEGLKKIWWHWGRSEVWLLRRGVVTSLVCLYVQACCPFSGRLAAEVLCARTRIKLWSQFLVSSSNTIKRRLIAPCNDCRTYTMNRYRGEPTRGFVSVK